MVASISTATFTPTKPALPTLDSVFQTQPSLSPPEIYPSFVPTFTVHDDIHKVKDGILKCFTVLPSYKNLNCDTYQHHDYCLTGFLNTKKFISESFPD